MLGPWLESYAHPLGCWRRTSVPLLIGLYSELRCPHTPALPKEYIKRGLTIKFSYGVACLACANHRFYLQQHSEHGSPISSFQSHLRLPNGSDDGVSSPTGGRVTACPHINGLKAYFRIVSSYKCKSFVCVEVPNLHGVSLAGKGVWEGAF